jgi:hypothetical protein
MDEMIVWDSDLLRRQQQQRESHETAWLCGARRFGPIEKRYSSAPRCRWGNTYSFVRLCAIDVGLVVME